VEGFWKQIIEQLLDSSKNDRTGLKAEEYRSSRETELGNSFLKAQDCY
jgi:hypothetical protein